MTDVEVRALRRVIVRLGAVFDSYAVTDDPETRETHRAFVDDRNYRQVVAKVLRSRAGDLGIEYLGQRGDRGSALWRKTAEAVEDLPAHALADGHDAQPRPPSAAPPRQQPATTAAPSGLGPQHSGDSPYQARMRLHQSWYRDEVLCAPYGTGPTASSTSRYGNMLVAQAATGGANFLTDQIHAHYRERVTAEVPNIDGFRTERNLLSSQAMCFNLFAPLADDLELATHCLEQLLPGEVAHVRRVEVEHMPATTEEYLGDGTSFDALIVYDDPAGHRGFLGVETKLHEPIRSKVYDRPRYRELARRDDAPWVAGAEEEIANPALNQLWRNHLLVEAVARHPAGDCGRRGRFMFVWHPRDEQRTAVVETYTGLLTDPAASFVAAPLDRLVGAWRAAALSAAEQAWAYHLWLRYVDLQASTHASG